MSLFIDPYASYGSCLTSWSLSSSSSPNRALDPAASLRNLSLKSVSIVYYNSLSCLVSSCLIFWVFTWSNFSNVLATREKLPFIKDSMKSSQSIYESSMISSGAGIFIARAKTSREIELSIYIVSVLSAGFFCHRFLSCCCSPDFLVSSSWRAWVI